jgi:hypothetical protein
MKRLVKVCIGVMVGIVFLWGGAGEAACRKSKINRKGSPAGTAITVSSTAVVVADANTSRCSLLIRNTSSNGMVCRSAGEGLPTTTLGISIATGGVLSIGEEGQEIWRCIRSGASDATAEVVEGMP